MSDKNKTLKTKILKIGKKVLFFILLLMLINAIPLAFYIPFYDLLLLNLDKSLNVNKLIQAIGYFAIINICGFGAASLIKLKLEQYKEEL